MPPTILSRSGSASKSDTTKANGVAAKKRARNRKPDAPAIRRFTRIGNHPVAHVDESMRNPIPAAEPERRWACVRVAATISDNSLTCADGSTERLHRTEQKVFEL